MENDISISEPSDEDIRYTADFCQCVGFVVLHWALIEQQLDNWINIFCNDCGGKPLLDGAGMPQSLKRKSKYIRRCLNRLPNLAPFRDECAGLLERTLSASNKRHDLIHGAITELRPNPETGAFSFRRIGYELDSHTIRDYTVTPDDFRTFFPMLTDLVTDAITLSRKLEGRFLKQKG